MNIMEFDTERLNIILSKLIAQRNKISEILNNVKLDNNKLQELWQGDNGSEALTRIKKQENKYEGIITQLDNFITFLHATIENYMKQQELTNKSLEQNANY